MSGDIAILPLATIPPGSMSEDVRFHIVSTIGPGDRVRIKPLEGAEGRVVEMVIRCGAQLRFDVVYWFNGKRESALLWEDELERVM